MAYHAGQIFDNISIEDDERIYDYYRANFDSQLTMSGDEIFETQTQDEIVGPSYSVGSGLLTSILLRKIRLVG